MIAPFVRVTSYWTPEHDSTLIASLHDECPQPKKNVAHINTELSILASAKSVICYPFPFMVSQRQAEQIVCSLLKIKMATVELEATHAARLNTS